MSAQQFLYYLSGRKYMRILAAVFVFIFPSLIFAKELPLQTLKLPPGFAINLYASPVNDARGLALGDKGVVFVGTKADKVYAILPEQDANGLHKVVTIASGLNQPNGVAFYKGALYVAEIDRIIKYPDIIQHLTDPPKPELVTKDVPVKVAGGRYQTQHAWKTIAFSPNGKLYMAVGVPCDACLPEDKRFGTIMRMQPDGSNREIYASGVRNSVGFAWDPVADKFWFTDNGRDWMGDNRPPDKLEYAPVKGLFFGFPYYHGLDQNGKPISDPKFGKLRSPDGITWPIYQLPAHVAVLGMTFYTGKMFPAAYHNQIILAEHGSWNSSKKVGYRLTIITLNKQRQPISYQPFVTGWEKDESAWGRPVATLVMPDGSLLVSDDYAGVIYRITYGK